MAGVAKLYNLPMSDQQSPRKQDKKNLPALLKESVAPVMKELQSDSSALQMPDLALRCSQFFHSMSKYCMQFYRKHRHEQEVKKTKMIKKQEKEAKGGRGRGRKREEGGEQANESKRPDLPKKPLTAYIIYFQDKKPMFVERYPTLNLSELTKLIAKQWKELTEEEKQGYLTKAADDRKRYEDEMNEFKRCYGRNFADEQLENQEEDIEMIIKENAQPAVEDVREEQVEEGAEVGEKSAMVDESEQKGQQNEEGEQQEEIQVQGDGQESEEAALGDGLEEQEDDEAEADEGESEEKGGRSEEELAGQEVQQISSQN